MHTHVLIAAQQPPNTHPCLDCCPATTRYIPMSQLLVRSHPLMWLFLCLASNRPPLRLFLCLASNHPPMWLYLCLASSQPPRPLLCFPGRGLSRRSAQNFENVFPYKPVMAAGASLLQFVLRSRNPRTTTTTTIRTTIRSQRLHITAWAPSL